MPLSYRIGFGRIWAFSFFSFFAWMFQQKSRQSLYTRGRSVHPSEMSLGSDGDSGSKNVTIMISSLSEYLGKLVLIFVISVMNFCLISENMWQYKSTWGMLSTVWQVRQRLDLSLPILCSSSFVWYAPSKNQIWAVHFLTLLESNPACS